MYISKIIAIEGNLAIKGSNLLSVKLRNELQLYYVHLSRTITGHLTGWKYRAEVGHSLTVINFDIFKCLLKFEIHLIKHNGIF